MAAADGRPWGRAWPRAARRPGAFKYPVAEAQFLAPVHDPHKIVCIGLSHKTAPIEVREKFAIGDSHLGEVSAVLAKTTGLREAVVVSTCNRVEYYAATDDPARAIDALRGRVGDHASFRIMRGEEGVMRFHLHAVIRIPARVPATDNQHIPHGNGACIRHTRHAAHGPALFAIFEVVTACPKRSTHDEFLHAIMPPYQRR